MTAGYPLEMGSVAVVAWFSAVLQTLLVTVVAFGLLCLLVSFLRFQAMTRAVAQRGDHAPPEEVLRFEIIRRLGTAHRAPAPFTVILIGVSDLDVLAGAHGAQAGREVIEFVRAWVAGRVRRSDAVCLFHERRVAAVVDTARENGARIAARLTEGLAGSSCPCGSDLVVRLAVNAGVASFPENGDRVEALVAAAETALVKAISEGTNRYQVAEPAASPSAGALAGEGAPVAPGQSALVDPLTGVLRGDRLATALQKYVARYRRENQPVSLLYLDVDALERYNTHYGRAAGDAILKALGELLQAHVREGDLIGRYEGEEFLVAMPCAPAEAMTAAQRLALAAKRTSVPWTQSPLRFTVSVGVAGYPDHGGRPAQLFEAAAAALKAAKAKGRGCWMMYDRSLAKTVEQEHALDTF